MTGLEGGVQIGDPIPDYSLSCLGKTQSCNIGSFNSMAMNKIVFGPDDDGSCSKTQKERRGMCDVFEDVRIDNVEVTYTSSGLGTAGFPADPVPLITVKVTDMKFDFVFLDLFTPESFSTMPDVSVSKARGLLHFDDGGSRRRWRYEFVYPTCS